MAIVCEFCKKICFLIEGEYICEEGHISKFVKEISENTEFIRRSKVVKKKIEENVYKNYDSSYKHLLMFNLLYSCLSESLGLTNEKYFGYFINFISGDKSKVNDEIRMDYTTMVLLLYFAKREEAIINKKLIYFYDFINEIKNIEITKRIDHFKKLLVMQWHNLDKRHTNYNVYCIKSRRNILECLTGSGIPLNSIEIQIYKETGFMNPLVEYNKSLFREFKFDLNCLHLREISEKFCINLTKEMIFYFEKFFYIKQSEKCISIPEDDICIFLFLYNNYKKIEFKGENKGELIDCIITFLKTTKIKFYEEVYHFIFKSGLGDNEDLLGGRSFYKKHLHKKRFESIKFHLKKMQNLLKNKKNLKEKKEYLENGMI
ncbi:hypothetical protein NBO_66g0046 [Nosema bombycis CQ1]|uniref:Uncharacterized protein n=1 Tax=Nosema bombycis (strain CQ1 / CVCC 102059) TaxID=578461 RepID=R0KTM9_NOSB1|nr:hypothetical protein NBO_66g0046 [Nosema bombycis CQ1]|eukprot:EOB13587.1 hypothetical protein NBO_66g0046 [Nosema bombycis CQ1]